MFNKTFHGLFLIVCFSCGKSQNNETVETIHYQVDTVSVDAKGHIFDLTYSLANSDYCQQDGFLYTYNEFDHGIDKIDLDRLELVDKYRLQKEGPDGTGSWISSLKSMGNGKLFLAGQFGAHFNLEGKLVKKFEWDKAGKMRWVLFGSFLNRVSFQNRVFFKFFRPYFWVMPTPGGRKVGDRIE